ncbi:HNH endonuclease signature motif containing protein [Mumia sp. Pv 4-285]|uniref:HNH endonuclease signature motif containing protein n=1 Tax=Mumia qirimensis TaxID=3234852 RepID=UPI00351D0FBB
MFDIDAAGALEAALDALADQPVALATDEQTCEVLRRLGRAADRLDGLQATWFDQMQEQAAHDAEGAATAAAWARREMRWDAGQTRRATAAGRTMRVLPAVGSAHRAGEIRRAHVDAFTVALKKADREVVEAAEDVMLDVARMCEPDELSQQLTMLVEVAHPEELDRAYAAGMDKHDLTVARCGEGFHVNGFLDAVSGTRFKTWLTAASAPRGSDDARTPAQRRVDAVGDLAAAALEHGLPTDRGVRPQVGVMVDAEWLAGQPGAAPPVLAGWGPVGPKLFEYLSCGADRTDFLVDGATGGATPQADILNVGRTHRLATYKQRQVVLARQGWICASPGCRGTHLELHHVAWWDRDGGRTDLDNLVGLCPRCHQLIHIGKLWVESDGARGFVFRRRKGARIQEIEDHHRVQRRRLSDRLRELRALRCAPDAVPAQPRAAVAGAGTPERVAASERAGPPERVRPFDHERARRPALHRPRPDRHSPLEAHLDRLLRLRV